MSVVSLSPQPSAEASAADGFEPLRAPPGFVRHIGGFHVHDQQDVVAVRVAAEHLNSIGIAHGGFLATVADSAFGIVIKRRGALASPPPTVTLSIDYIGPARAGDWLEAHVEVHRTGRSVANASCMLKAGGRLVARVSGVFFMAASATRRQAQ